MAKISAKITNYLDKNGYKYEIIEHKTTFTAWDTAQTEKAKPEAVCKTLILKADSDWTVAVLPSNRNLDKAKFLKLFNVGKKKKGEKTAKKIEFAKEAWMKKNIIGKLGAVPPLKGLLKKDIFIDKLVLKNKKIYVGSGEYEFSIYIPVSQYVKKETPIGGNFSIKK